MRSLVVLFIISTFICESVNAQVSTMLLRNGKKVLISDYKIDGQGYYDGKIDFVNAKGKNKDKYLDEVFSIIDAKGQEKILYESNEELGEVLTVGQMSDYVSGMGDSRIYKISPLVMVGGFATGFGGTIIPQVKVSAGENSMGIPLGILVPATYVGIMGATTPKAETLQAELPEKANNEHYLMGYQDGVQKKRFKHSIIGAAIGVVGGIIFISAVN